MNSIADALVYAVAYINCRESEDGEDASDDDVGALESIAGFLHDITPAEEDALAAAAERALSAEVSSQRQRENLIEDYAHWMESMFGDGWEGNRRTEP